VAVRIRLRRIGKKKQPQYRLVAAEAAHPRDGRFIEVLGHYNPRVDPPAVSVNGERALYWLQHGAQPTDTAKSLLVRTGVWEQFTGEPTPAPRVPEKAPAEVPVEAAPEVAEDAAVEAPVAAAEEAAPEVAEEAAEAAGGEAAPEPEASAEPETADAAEGEEPEAPAVGAEAQAEGGDKEAQQG
jgi:small subunit ribosomal protein S16